LNYRNIGNRIDKLDGGNAQSNEATLFVVPEGESPPHEYDPDRHSIIWDGSETPSPISSMSRLQLNLLLVEIDGKSRSIVNDLL